MSTSSSLSVTSNSTREQVAALQLQVAAREHELNELKTDLRQLQTRYLDDIGPLYAELMPLDAAVMEEEIRLGLRLADEEDDFDVRSAVAEAAPCSPASASSDDLKRMFRDVAKAVHPDRADHHLDERTRYRRHSLMAEANRAYAERDADRLRLILHAWHLNNDNDAATADDPEAEQTRLQRRAASMAARLVEIDAEFADLRRSAIARLKTRIDEARAQGWDLLKEMMRQVRREIATAHAKLARMKQRR
jgi:hypothetical protein